MGILGSIIPTTQRHGIGCVRLRAETGLLFDVHRPALQHKAEDGGGAETGLVCWIDGAQIALGRDMQANGFGDRRPEPVGQQVCTEVARFICTAPRDC